MMNLQKTSDRLYHMEFMFLVSYDAREEKFLRNVNDVEVATLLERVRNAKEHVQIGIDTEDYYRLSMAWKRPII